MDVSCNEGGGCCFEIMRFVSVTRNISFNQI